MRLHARASVVLALLAIAAGLGLSAPQTMLAGDPDGNPSTYTLPGRPICGSANNLASACNSIDESACFGIAYANVDNKMVLLVAQHCRPYNQSHICTISTCYVRGNNGSIIGWWGNNDGGIFDEDLAIIWLFQGNWNGTRNRVFRGAVSGSDWWTITANPTSADGCGNIDVPNGIPFGRDTYQNWTYLSSDETPYRTGELSSFFVALPGECTVKTTLYWHDDFCRVFYGNGCIDSSSPFILHYRENTVFGFSTSRDQADNKLVIAPLYEGIKDLNAYYLTHGGNTGAWLCQVADCGGIGGW